ncbi:MAG: hypothetical protein HKN20_01070 [Gemmatimonadetes bacterium]|nr:hypothetical protein [Gemmatimonadota bacterium]
MSRFLTWFLVLTLFMTHGSGCSRMLVRDLDNRPAWKEDLGRRVVVYTIDREYFEGRLVKIGETEIVLAREGVQMNIPIDKIKQLSVHGIDQDQTVFMGITVALIVGLFVYAIWFSTAIGGGS